MRWVVVGIIFVIMGSAGAYFARGTRVAEVRLAAERAALPAPITPLPPANPTLNVVRATTTPREPSRPVVYPAEINLAVPFTTQAPFSVWDAVHEETCEEASAAMANAFFDKRTFTPQSAEDELQKVVAWEMDTFGHFEDTTAEETARLIRDYYGRQAEISTEVTVSRIKKEIVAGRLIILPAYGKGLNPFFKNGGPEYHMLVVKGYTRTRFITNDPGTRRGADFPYAFDKLLSAVHDWDPTTETASGPKVMIIVGP